MLAVSNKPGWFLRLNPSGLGMYGKATLSTSSYLPARQLSAREYVGKVLMLGCLLEVTVPAVQLPSGEVLTESADICIALEQLYSSVHSASDRSEESKHAEAAFMRRYNSDVSKSTYFNSHTCRMRELADR